MRFQSRKTFRSEPDMTPMLDMTFQLTFFFMLTLNFSSDIQSDLVRLPVSEIARQPLLLPKTGFSRRVMDKLFRPFGSQVQVRMELPSVGMIKSFVAAGMGVSLVSSSFARDEVAAGRVVLIPLQDVELWRELGLAYRRDRTHTRATTTFITTVRELHKVEK